MNLGVFVLLGFGAVAFVTLLERKLLGLSQIRLGPNKVGQAGILQPVFDGVKLLSKELHSIKVTQIVFFFSGPCLLIVLFLFVWEAILPWSSSGLYLTYCAVLFFFVLLGIGPYAVIIVGWASTSPFSKLGGMRGMLQSLSFEVAMVLVFFIPLFIYSSFSIKNESVLGAEFLGISGLWLTLVLMESNRAPFDLLEGESELISGFNIETSSLPFVFIFLSEYGMLLALGLMVSLGPLGGLYFFSLMGVGALLYVRSCYPRVRYDSLMGIMWHAILPVSLTFAVFSILMKLESGVMHT